MLEFLIPILIQGGVNLIQPVIVDAIIKNQDKKKFKSALLENVDALRKKAANQLYNVGKKKIEIFSGPVKEYLTLYSKIVGNNEILLGMVDDPLSSDECNWIVNGIKKADKLLDKCEGKLTKKASIGWAVYGCKTVINHSYSEDDYPYNATVMWLGGECFREDDKKGKYMCLFDGKIPGYLLHLCNFNASDYDIKHFNDLVDPKKIFSEEELNNLFKHQLPETFAEFQAIVDFFMERLIQSEEQLKAEIIRLNSIANKVNGSKASNNIATLLLNESLPALREIITFDSAYIFTTKGGYTDRFINICKSEAEKVICNISDSELEKYIKRYLDIKANKEENMSEINIKIIESEEYSNNTEFFKFDNNEKEWSPFSKDLKMIINKNNCQKLSKENFDSLFDIFDEYMAISEFSTSIYYIGDKVIFDDMNSYIMNRYSEVKAYNI